MWFQLTKNPENVHGNKELQRARISQTKAEAEREERRNKILWTSEMTCQVITQGIIVKPSTSQPLRLVRPTTGSLDASILPLRVLSICNQFELGAARVKCLSNMISTSYRANGHCLSRPRRSKSDHEHPRHFFKRQASV
jgi:hypothetical protein